MMDSHMRSLLPALLGAIGTLTVLKLHEAQTLWDYAMVVVLAISGAIALYILARVAIAMSKSFRDLG